ncbi:Ras-associating and dilute domain-containing protein [Clonorchis sinensis]|uniref:Ras-associating and dilute domain-containing protein n=1 Tax=Clonorchis sinensis TaxID=79923 RepID=G7Y4L6_CLOSI|nr:Ras-associating and dilute domain-containing protein [Clonorchis sinensis]
MNRTEANFNEYPINREGRETMLVRPRTIDYSNMRLCESHGHPPISLNGSRKCTNPHTMARSSLFVTNSNGYGIFIVNYGPQDKPGVFVSDLAPNGAAAQHGELCPNDRILAVNGQIQTDYDSTLSLMKQSTTRVRLTIARRKPAIQSPGKAATKPVATSSPAPSASVTNAPLERPKPPPIVPGRETLVELTRHSGSSWGFSVVGGKDTVLMQQNAGITGFVPSKPKTVESSKPDKLETLIHFVDPLAYDHIPGHTDYESAIDRLRKLYVRPKNVMYARYLLQTYKQENGQDIDQFIRKLKSLAKDCEFKSVSATEYQDECVRDAMVNGVASTSIREKLLAQSELTLDQAYQLATSLELAHKQSLSYVSNEPISCTTIPPISQNPELLTLFEDKG